MKRAKLNPSVQTKTHIVLHNTLLQLWHTYRATVVILIPEPVRQIPSVGSHVVDQVRFLLDVLAVVGRVVEKVVEVTDTLEAEEKDVVAGDRIGAAVNLHMISRLNTGYVLLAYFLGQLFGMLSPLGKLGGSRRCLIRPLKTAGLGG